MSSVLGWAAVRRPCSVFDPWRSFADSFLVIVAFVVHSEGIENQVGGRFDIPQRVEAGELVPRLDARLPKKANGHAILLRLVSELVALRHSLRPFLPLV